MKPNMIALAMALLIAISYLPSTLAVPLEGRAYLVSLHYKSGAIRDVSVKLVDAQAPKQSFVDGPSFKVAVKSKDKTLFERTFVIPASLEVMPRPGEEFGPYAPVDDMIYTELVPYFTDGTEISITDPSGNPVSIESPQGPPQGTATGPMPGSPSKDPWDKPSPQQNGKTPSRKPSPPGSIDLTPFALCDQDGVCDDRETSKVCPQDCKPGEKGPVQKFIDGDKITPQEAEEWDLPLGEGNPLQSGKSSADCPGGVCLKKTPQGSKLVVSGWPLWIIILLVIAGVIFFIKRRTSKAKKGKKSKEGTD